MASEEEEQITTSEDEDKEMYTLTIEYQARLAHWIKCFTIQGLENVRKDHDDDDDYDFDFNILASKLRKDETLWQKLLEKGQLYMKDEGDGSKYTWEIIFVQLRKGKRKQCDVRL